MTAWVPAACLLLAAVPVAWPRPGPGRRLRRLADGADVLHPQRRDPVRVCCRDSDNRRTRTAWWPVLLVVALVMVAAAVGGAVAAVVAGTYGSVGARGFVLRARRQLTAARRRELLDRLGAAAADLRAGLPVEKALGGGLSMAPGDGLGSWVGAAARLAERTGAPLAELLERVEADARASDRAHAAAAAQAAGSLATAWLLAGLPLGGIGLGYAIGADPLSVLLHTPLGAGCTFGALALQLAGLAWSRRIIRPERTAGAAA
jgi:Flp pilus assembly protein TadB